MKKYILFLILFKTALSYSQDIRGAYIHAGMTSGSTYSIGVVLYTDASQSLARPTITVTFGDNTTGTFSLSSSATSGNLGIKTYTGSHTYPGFGQYLVNYIDTYRIPGIKNIQNSSTQQIGVTTALNLASFVSSNSDPVMINPPVGMSVVNNTLTYNPAFNSPSGDSLSYSLDNFVGSGYYIPNGASLGATSGVFTFSNDTTGTYAFRYTVRIWRKNVQGSYMQIGSCQMDFLVDVTGTVGIDENFLTNTLRVFPNPFTNRINIGFDNSNRLPDKISLSNNLGWVLVESDAPLRELDLSYLATGVYYLKASFSASQHRVFKLVKE